MSFCRWLWLRLRSSPDVDVELPAVEVVFSRFLLACSSESVIRVGVTFVSMSGVADVGLYSAPTRVAAVYAPVVVCASRVQARKRSSEATHQSCGQVVSPLRRTNANGVDKLYVSVYVRTPCAS